MNLTKNFKLSEFACNDGTPVPVELWPNVRELADNLQVLRDYLNTPIRINSAYRTPHHNKRVKGSPNSQHLYAKAADIVVVGFTPDDVAETIEELIQQGKMAQGGLGIYRTFTHYDIRGKKARWRG